MLSFCKQKMAALKKKLSQHFTACYKTIYIISDNLKKIYILLYTYVTTKYIVHRVAMLLLFILNSHVDRVLTYYEYSNVNFIVSNKKFVFIGFFT